MDSNIRVEYKLNRIINTITEQNKIKLNELYRYPLCMLYGQFPSNLREMIQLELGSKIGTEEAVELLSFEKGNDIEGQTAEVINRFRKKIENKELNILDKYYIPVIFMADQMDAQDMQDTLQKFQMQMKRMGFEHSYQIWYYCIFNYETMNGKKCKEQITSLLEKEESKYPFGIYTQSNLFVTEYQKYLKTIQSIAMHIFLKISKQDKHILATKAEQNIPQMYVMGYWKLDIFKQKTVDYLISTIKKQDQDLISFSGYITQIKEILDEIFISEEDTWLQAFWQIPVNYTKIKDFLQSKPFMLKRPTMEYGELLERLYGKPDVFSCFIKENWGSGAEEKFLEKFLNKDIGNLYAVEVHLKEVLLRLRTEYQNEKEKIQMGSRSYGDIFRLERTYKLADILKNLRVFFWEGEAKCFALERKIRFINRLIDYLDSYEFKETIEQIRKRSRTQINRLELVRREVSMEEESILQTTDIRNLNIEDNRIPGWKEDIFDDVSMHYILQNMPQLNQMVENWTKKNRKEILGIFVNRLQELKRNRQMEEYYSARIDIPRMTETTEYVYLGRQEFQNENELEKMQELVRVKLPNACLLERSWETNMCFEVFAAKKIENLSEIYNID